MIIIIRVNYDDMYVYNPFILHVDSASKWYCILRTTGWGSLVPSISPPRWDRWSRQHFVLVFCDGTSTCCHHNFRYALRPHSLCNDFVLYVINSVLYSSCNDFVSYTSAACHHSSASLRTPEALWVSYCRCCLIGDLEDGQQFVIEFLVDGD